MVKNRAHIWPEVISEANGIVTTSAVIELANGERSQLWYRLPSSYRYCLTSSCDTFVIATIFLFMSQGIDVMVHGESSPSLLSNLEEFQAAWSSWRPQWFNPINIYVETAREQPPVMASERAIASFSGGVDSCFTAFRHYTSRCGWQRRNLRAGLMVHGFDIPLDDIAFERAAQNSEIMLASLDMECIQVATNFKDAIGLDWETIFGTGIASCFHLLKAGFSTGLIASSHQYQTLNFVYGSNPITDRMLSSQFFEIVHDGARYSRLDKIRGILDWPEAMENLRVCWQGSQRDRNCGRCEKCVRVVLNFRVAGAGLPPCFDHDVSDQQIASTRLGETSLEIWETLLTRARSFNLSGSWLKAMELAIRINRPMVFVMNSHQRDAITWLRILVLRLDRIMAIIRRRTFSKKL